jgi:hypothetical protein
VFFLFYLALLLGLIWCCCFSKSGTQENLELQTCLNNKLIIQKTKKLFAS